MYFCPVIQFAKTIRIITSLLFIAVLALSYAYLPLTLDMNWQGMPRMDRDIFFYAALGLFIFFNFATYFFRWSADRLGTKPNTRLMVHLLPSFLYFAMVTLIGYIVVWNNATDVSPDDYFYLNYISIFLILGWTVLFIYFLIRKQ
jgi:hypothetical protein